jgi:hypothetical protein
MKSWLNVRHWPLRLRIVLLLFVSSMLPLAIVGYIEFHYARAAVLKSTAELLTARGDEVAGKLDAFHKLYQLASERLARLPDIVRYVDTPAVARQKLAPAARGILDVWRESDAHIRGLTILDSTGTVVLGTEEPLNGRNVASYRFVQETLNGTPTIFDLHVSGPETGSVPTIAYLAPIKDAQRKVAGAIVVWVQASVFWSATSSLR